VNGLFIAIIGIGLLASMSPSRLIVFNLLLATSRAIRNAAAFLSGWLASLIVIFTIVSAAGGSTSKPHTTAHTASVFAEILLGVLFAAVGRVDGSIAIFRECVPGARKVWRRA